MAMGMVMGIQRFTMCAGPGIRTTVFLKGCVLRCPWCFNPEGWDPQPEILFFRLKCGRCGACVEACPAGAVNVDRPGLIDRRRCTRCMKCVEACHYGALMKVGEWMDVAAVLDEVLRDMPFYVNSGGGLTVSGGEPLLQADFVAELLREAKRRGLHTCLDTAGYAPGVAVEKVLPWVDLVLFDVKHHGPTAHYRWLGVPNWLILDNLRRFAAATEVVLRVPVVPGFNDDREFFEEVADLALSLGIEVVDLLPYHGLGEPKWRMLGRTMQFEAGELSPGKVTGFLQALVGRGLAAEVGG